MKHKLKSARGETLTETLAAILVVSLSAVVLTAMSVTSVHINRAADEADRQFREEVLAAELQEAGESGTARAAVTAPGLSYHYTVRITGGEGRLASYAPGTEGTP